MTLKTGCFIFQFSIQLYITSLEKTSCKPHTPRKLQHTPRAHPRQSPWPTMKGIPAYSLLVKVFPGCVPVRCVETTLDIHILGDRLQIHFDSRVPLQGLLLNAATDTPIVYLAKFEYFTNLNFPEIAGVPFPFQFATFWGPGLVRSLSFDLYVLEISLYCRCVSI